MIKFITNGNIVLPDRVEYGTLVIEDGVIKDSFYRGEIPENADIVDADGGYVLAGFIDTHLHGGGGFDFMDGTVEAFEQISKTHMQHGTTSLMPTTVSCSKESMKSVFDTYRKAASLKTGANLLGVHLEGPFIAMESKGAQNPMYIRNPSKYEVDELLECGGDIIARCSCAPELGGTDYLAEKMSEKGIWLSVAHSNAVCGDIIGAYEKGFAHVTHMYSGTTTFRKIGQTVYVGIVEAAYLIDGMNVELIGDGKHVPKELIQMVLKVKGDDKLSLVTDAMRAAGCDVTESYLGEIKPENRVIIEDGVAKLPDRSFYAGSIATMDIAFRNAVDNAGLDLPTASKLVSANPAILSGAKNKGTIETGKDADIVIMDKNKAVSRVFVGGEERFCK